MVIIIIIIIIIKGTATGSTIKYTKHSIQVVQHNVGLHGKLSATVTTLGCKLNNVLLMSILYIILISARTKMSVVAELVCRPNDCRPRGFSVAAPSVLYGTHSLLSLALDLHHILSTVSVPPIVAHTSPSDSACSRH